MAWLHIAWLWVLNSAHALMYQSPIWFSAWWNRVLLLRYISSRFSAHAVS